MINLSIDCLSLETSDISNLLYRKHGNSESFKSLSHKLVNLQKFSFKNESVLYSKRKSIKLTPRIKNSKSKTYHTNSLKLSSYDEREYKKLKIKRMNT